jgi:hypothetical protein
VHDSGCEGEDENQEKQKAHVKHTESPTGDHSGHDRLPATIVIVMAGGVTATSPRGASFTNDYERGRLPMRRPDGLTQD